MSQFVLGMLLSTGNNPGSICISLYTFLMVVGEMLAASAMSFSHLFWSLSLVTIKMLAAAIELGLLPSS